VSHFAACSVIWQDSGCTGKGGLAGAYKFQHGSNVVNVVMGLSCSRGISYFVWTTHSAFSVVISVSIVLWQQCSADCFRLLEKWVGIFENMHYNSKSCTAVMCSNNMA